MNPKQINKRYFFSVLIDYVILICIAYPMSLFFPDRNNPTFFVVLIVLLFLYMIQDKIFRNKSVGKMILLIRIEPLHQGQLISVFNVIVRRILEWMYVYKLIFWRLYINIDKISNTKIVMVNSSNKKEIVKATEVNQRPFLSYQDKSLMKIRAKAFFIDFLLISWVIAFLIIINLSSVIIYLNGISQYLSLSLDLAISLIFVFYWAFKDLRFQNGSYGKHALGIGIFDLEGNLPSKFSLVIRNIVSFGFSPIELTLFLLNRRGIGELLTYTIVRKIKK